MSKLVVLKFSGSLNSGFTVVSEIGQEGQAVDRGRVGSLPPAPELSLCLANWQQQYNQLGNNYRIKPQQIIYNGGINPYAKLIESASKLRQALAKWLNSPGFNSIDKHLREALNREETIRILICSDRPKIYQLPWCCWDLVESYPHLGIAYSNPNFTRVPLKNGVNQHRKVRILAILGDAQGIDLTRDCFYLDDITKGEVKFLIEPTPQELYQHLWQKTWDIVFFAGHSQTQARQGILHLNAEDQLTIEQLRHGFKRAIAHGLQLAIFNSCDGLGLAQELGQLSLPQSIVMRMPIPDQMAQQFVKYFLQAYAAGNSLYMAMRKAREQLQGWEKQFPCASWLPIIYQNPAIIPPSWSDLQNKQPFWQRLTKLRTKQKPLTELEELRELASRKALTSIFLLTTLTTSLVWLVQSWGWLETSELKVYDRLMSGGFISPLPERVVVITIDDHDQAYQRTQGMGRDMRGSLADTALDKLIKKLQMGQASVIASDIIHDFPFETKLAQTIAQTKNFVAICRIKIDQPQLPSIAPPPQLSTAQIGFSNWAIDRDETVRRQILGMSPDNVCQSDLSLSLRLALQYLGDISAGFNPQGEFQLENTIFPKLQVTSGGYHLPEARGYQILLNYRRTLPPTVPLRTILTMPQQEVNQLVQDKAVLIGVAGHNQDLHRTPYRQGEQDKYLPGVIIHALMTNQIIDAVLGERKLLRWVSEQVELLWIAFWAIVGTMIVIITKASPLQICLRTIGSLALLFGSCWLLFLNSVWLVAIAPALGLCLSAFLVAVYSRD
ncbi:MAG: CHASE2 domain-containing protein [Cyanobacteria bacterium P01_G01_bin.39]